MPWGAIIGVVGGMMSADAAGDASDAQVGSSREATQLQRDMYEQTRADQAGYRQRGDAAGNRLAYMMGLQPTGGGGQTYNKTADQFRQELMGQYSGGARTGAASGSGSMEDYDAAVRRFMQPGESGLSARVRAGIRAREAGFMPPDQAQGSYVQTLIKGTGADDGSWYEPRWQEGGTGQSSIDESGLNSAVQAAMAQQERDRLAAEQAAGGDPAYGSLLRNFSASDLSSDPLYAMQKPLIDAAMQRASGFETAPGYQFRKEEGQRGVENSAAARGGLLSGAALKAIQRYGQDFASNEYGNWFNQSNADRNYIAGQGDASFNRFNTGTTNQYNRLAGISGTGQQATNLVNTAGANFANQAAQNTMGAGNAQAAGIVGQANALSGGLTGAYNTYQNNQLMNLIRNPQGTGGWGSSGGWTGGGRVVPDYPGAEY